MYNDVLNPASPEDAKMVGYDDNISLTAATKRLKDAELYSCEEITAIWAWFKSAGQALVGDKGKRPSSVTPVKEITLASSHIITSCYS